MVSAGSPVVDTEVQSLMIVDVQSACSELYTINPTVSVSRESLVECHCRRRQYSGDYGR